MSTCLSSEGSIRTLPTWWKADLFCRAPSMVTFSRLSSIPCTKTFWAIGAPPEAVISVCPSNTSAMVWALRSSISSSEMRVLPSTSCAASDSTRIVSSSTASCARTGAAPQPVQIAAPVSRSARVVNVMSRSRNDIFCGLAGRRHAAVGLAVRSAIVNQTKIVNY